MMAGGVIMSTWGGFKHRGKTLAVGLFAFGSFAIGMGFSKNFIFYLGLMVCYGVALTMVQTAITTMLQEKTDTSMQGRVFGLLGTMYAGFLPIAVILFVAFGLLVAILNGTGRLTGGVSLFLNLAIGFGIEACVIVLITTCLGAIVINLSRNIIVTSVVGVIYGFASCLVIGSENGFVIPGSFAYRVSMSFLDKATYYDAPVPATIGGCISFVLCFAVMFLVGLLVFSHKKKIEN